MRKLQRNTTLALLLNVLALVCLFVGFPVISSIFSLLAFFLAMNEVSKYTSAYQFANVFAATVLMGLSLDLPNENLPFTTLALMLVFCTTLTRIIFFKTFSYTSYAWFEPLCFFLALTVWILSNLLFHHDWKGYAFPLPLFIFAGIFSWGIIKDKNQLLKSARGGYKVQIGRHADEFELPDQEGNLVKLSDFRNKRHVLLIFVRGDWCPGCHMMLRTYEKNNHKFKEKNILVMAIGPDPVGVNRGMVEKLGLDFRVLSDEGQRTAMNYGVQLKEYDNDFAEKYEEGIPLPASFLVDKNGIVRYVSRPDKVGEFLNPSLIFPIVEQLDSKQRSNMFANETEDVKQKNELTREELKNYEAILTTFKKELNNYRSIIDKANDAIIVIDIVDGKIHQSNPAAANLLGYNNEELESISLFDLHPTEYLDRSSKIVADVWEKGGLIYTDIPFVTRTKELIPVECSAKVAPFAGRPAIVIYARDIRERIRLQNEINEQRRVIDEKSQDIKDSIEYSKRIQRSILKERDKIRAYAQESFILFNPKDVVSGDFYWFESEEQNGEKLLKVAAVDCTGHGVPGAFMSLIGNSLLNNTLNNPVVINPAKALDFVDAELKKSLNKNAEDKPLRDGMDINLCYVDLKNRKLQYAGANNPLYVVRGNELIVLNADKQPITASTEHEVHPFTNQVFELQQNDSVYLFTDGYADQFGGPNGKKFMYKRFKETLLSLQNRSMAEQKTELFRIFQEWKGNLEQVDDVLVIGIRVT
ncbi:MAG: redoxin domain-containing protein [Bacteroidia bacterium]|nr:redoxin domain-containing protein [Bacteroidia bacterium]